MATTSIRVVERRRRYHWPDAQLNFWIFIMLVASSTTLGIFAYFMNVQSALQLGIPWLFPYEVTVSSLALAFLILILILISQRQLLPGIVILGTFILFVLWLTGLIETAIQLFGPTGSVNSSCNLYVTSMPVTGTSNLEGVLRIWSSGASVRVGARRLRLRWWDGVFSVDDDYGVAGSTG